MTGGDTGSSDDPTDNGGGAVYQNTATGAVTVSGTTLDHDTATVKSGECCHGGGAIYLNAGSPYPPFTVSSSHLDYDSTSVTTTDQRYGCCSGGGAVSTFGGIDATSTTFDHDSATLTGQECCNGGGAAIFDTHTATISFDKADLSHDTVTVSGPGLGPDDVCCNGGGALQFVALSPTVSVLGSASQRQRVAQRHHTLWGGRGLRGRGRPLGHLLELDNRR